MNSTLSWGLVYFLMNTQDGRRVLSRTIDALKTDENKTSVVVLNDLYDGGLDELEREFHLFVTQMPSMQEI